MKKHVKKIICLIVVIIVISALGITQLFAASTLRKGDSGSEVRTLQNQLIKLGFYLGSSGADGVFGQYTLDAVKGVQSATGITVDGIVGPNTRSAITKFLNAPNNCNTAHFNQSEFKCKHCGKLPSGGIPKKLLLRLEALRAKCGNKPITITSGYRCPTHNANVGGATNSQHLYGKAADIKVSGVSASTVYNYADKIFGDGGVGKYSTFTHVDVRNGRARWVG